MFLIYVKGGFNVVADEKTFMQKKSMFNTTKLACRLLLYLQLPYGPLLYLTQELQERQIT